MQLRHAVALTLTIAAWLAAPPAPAAGDETIVNALEVRRLVARGEPDDHRRLARHFAALASQYATELQRLERLARAVPASPSRQPVASFTAAAAGRAADVRAHLATLCRLSAYHIARAAGESPAPPEGATAFWAGYGAPSPTRDEIRQIERAARLPAEHRDLEEYFTGVARSHEGTAERHRTQALILRGTRLAQAATYYERRATDARLEAEWASGRALMHRQFAAIAW